MTAAPLPNGFVAWAGGEMPASGDTLVRVLLKWHGTDLVEPRDKHGSRIVCSASEYHWQIDQTKPGAIIAYRKEPENEQA